MARPSGEWYQMAEKRNWPYFSWRKSKMCDFLRWKSDLRTLAESGIIGHSMAEFGIRKYIHMNLLEAETENGIRMKGGNRI